MEEKGLLLTKFDHGFADLLDHETIKDVLQNVGWKYGVGLRSCLLLLNLEESSADAQIIISKMSKFSNDASHTNENIDISSNSFPDLSSNAFPDISSSNRNLCLIDNKHNDWNENDVRKCTKVQNSARFNQVVKNNVNNYSFDVPKTVDKPFLSPASNNLKRVMNIVNVYEKLFVVLRGLPGSGKSTVGRKIAQNRGRIFSTDDFFLQSSGRYIFEPYRLGEAHQWNQNRCRRAVLEEVTPIIVDNTNLKKWEMEVYIHMALDANYHIEIIEPDTYWRYDPYELAKRNEHGVQQNKIIEMLNKFEKNITVRDFVSPYNKNSNMKSAKNHNQKNRKTRYQNGPALNIFNDIKFKNIDTVNRSSSNNIQNLDNFHVETDSHSNILSDDETERTLETLNNSQTALERCTSLPLINNIEGVSPEPAANYQHAKSSSNTKLINSSTELGINYFGKSEPSKENITSSNSFAELENVVNEESIECWGLSNNLSSFNIDNSQNKSFQNNESALENYEINPDFIENKLENLTIDNDQKSKAWESESGSEVGYERNNAPVENLSHTGAIPKKFNNKRYKYHDERENRNVSPFLQFNPNSMNEAMESFNRLKNEDAVNLLEKYPDVINFENSLIDNCTRERNLLPEFENDISLSKSIDSNETRSDHINSYAMSDSNNWQHFKVNIKPEDTNSDSKNNFSLLDINNVGETKPDSLPGILPILPGSDFASFYAETSKDFSTQTEELVILDTDKIIEGNPDRLMPGKELDYYAKMFKLHEKYTSVGTMTEDLIVNEESKGRLEDVLAFFPLVPTEYIADMFAKCNNDVDWTMSILSDEIGKDYLSENIESSNVPRKKQTSRPNTPSKAKTSNKSCTPSKVNRGPSKRNNSVSDVRKDSLYESNLIKNIESSDNIFGGSRSLSNSPMRLITHQSDDINENVMLQNKVPESGISVTNSEQESFSDSSSGIDGTNCISMDLDPLFALQLVNLFGPVANLDLDHSFEKEQLKITLPLEVCRQIHSEWNAIMCKDLGVVNNLSQTAGDEAVAMELQRQENERSANPIQNFDPAQSFNKSFTNAGGKLY